ncbi:PVC-type heme-binding CxxCH protein [Alienimonas californiensis]|uniref:Cytochrome c n=1 Tax=Alienimonas californiensis TaxID=2527989 RepID=A0A517PE11_9PLAN|nr:PVC-type heme-binding CxxCH protein [Alienimonas californiensis]QDT17615.1 Cytochrome c [Alienimonas californiensis]
MQLLQRGAGGVAAPARVAAAILLAGAAFCPHAATVAQDEESQREDYAAELPRIPPRSPEEGLKSLRTLPGFRIDLVAAEPLVTDPVAMSFDADGRLYVVEMRDYSEQDQARLGRIRLLEDTDRDGTFDAATAFAEGLSWPTAVIAYDGGVFVGAPPLMLYLKDTTGDGRADERRVVFEGFDRSNVQGLMNSLRWGLDNRIHGATGTAGGTVVRPDAPDRTPVDLDGRDFSFDPRTLDLRAEPGGAQHGMGFDDWGRKFSSSNSDHLQYVVYRPRYAARFPELSAPRVRHSIAADGPQAPVFRRSPVEPWRTLRTRLRVAGAVPGPVEGGGTPAGYFTGATGATIYRGDAMPSERGRAFVADVGSNLVHRKTVSFEGIVPVARRIDEGTEFLASDDIWFRPVQFADAPDGGLSVLDMSRETIEHPKSLPDSIKRHLDLTSGRDRGRLYRIVPDGYQHRPAPTLSDAATEDLVALLAHDNGWHRETAARLLYERQDPRAFGPLQKLLRTSDLPLGRLHALAAIEGLGLLDESAVLAGLRDEHPRVREFALRLSERFPQSTPIREQLASLLDDPDPLVRFQLAFTIGEFPSAGRVPIAAELLARFGDDPWMRFATFSSLSTGAGQVVAARLAAEPDGDAEAAVGALAELVGLQADPAEVAAVLRATSRVPGSDPRTATALTQLTRGLKASRNPIAEELADGDGLAEILEDLLATARVTVDDPNRPLDERVAAIRTLAAGASPNDVRRLLDRLNPREPAQIQRAAFETLSALDDDALGEELVRRWPNLGPELQNAVFDTLLSRIQWNDALLTAIESGEVPRSRWSPERLRLHRLAVDAETAARIDAILAKVDVGSRAEALAQYGAALTRPGDAAAGRNVFLKHCATCHRVGEEGATIGPNLVAATARGRETLLVNVLDPNREANPEYLSYVALLEDGRTHTGLIVEQSATGVTLRRVDQPDLTIRRDEIELLQSSGLSLMPEGLEREITPQQMADLFAFLERSN